MCRAEKRRLDANDNANYGETSWLRYNYSRSGVQTANGVVSVSRLLDYCQQKVVRAVLVRAVVGFVVRFAYIHDSRWAVARHHCWWMAKHRNDDP